MLPGLARNRAGPGRKGDPSPTQLWSNVVGEITTLVTSAGPADGIWSPQWDKGGILRIKVRNR